MRRNSAKYIAMGGVFAALAVVIMCLGTIIPVATFVCPMACMVLLTVVYRLTGVRIAWAWYAAVSILSLLLGPDKEAASVSRLSSYYQALDRQKEVSFSLETCGIQCINLPDVQCTDLYVRYGCHRGGF